MNIPMARLRENAFDFVHDSQRIFKTLMMSLAFPGKIHLLELLPLSIVQLDRMFILQPLLCLLDLETSACVYSQDEVISNIVTQYLSINTNCRILGHKKADYILCLEPSLNGRYGELKTGSLSSPDRSATVFYLVNRLCSHGEADSINLIITGPGVETETRVCIRGLDEKEINSWNFYRHHYPVGVDIFLVSRTGEIIGIPRSANTRIQEGSD